MQLSSGLPEGTVKSLSWIPLAALTIFVIGFNIGLGERVSCFYALYENYIIFQVFLSNQSKWYIHIFNVNNINQLRTPAMGTEWRDVFWRSQEHVKRSLHSHQLDHNISGADKQDHQCISMIVLINVENVKSTLTGLHGVVINV